MNLLFSIALVMFLMLGISGQEDTPDNTDTMRIYLVMIPDSKVESLRRRHGRQEEAAAGAAGSVLEAGAGGAASYVGLILNGVLGADVRPIFQGTTAFIPEGEVRDGITDILQRGIAPVLNRIFKELQQNVANRFNITSTTPQPSSIPILQNQNQQEQTEIQTNQNQNQNLQPSSFTQTQSQLEQHQLQQQQLNQLNNEFQSQPQFSNNNFNQYQQPIYNQFQPQNQQIGATNQFQSPASPQLQPPFDSKYQQPQLPVQSSGQNHAPLKGNPVIPIFQNQRTRTRIDPLQQTHQFQRTDLLPVPTSNFSVSEVDESKVYFAE